MGLTLFRENLFLEINAILSGENVNRANFYLFYDFFINFSTEQLIQLKYIATLSFIFGFSLLTYLTIKCWFKNKQYNKITLVVIGVFIGLFLLGIGVFKVLGVYSENYFIFRKAIGFLQSPLLLFILLSLFFFLDKEKAD